MPTVGNKKFSYTTAGQDAARKYAKDTKQSIVYSYNEGGLYQSPYNTGAVVGSNRMSNNEQDSARKPTMIYDTDFMKNYISNQEGSKSNEERRNPEMSGVMMNTEFDKEDYMNKLKQMEEGGEVEGPKYPHDMYNPSTGEKFVAQNKEDHDEMSEKGYKHLDELDANEKKMVEDKVNQMAMGGKYEQFKRMMGLD